MAPTVLLVDTCVSSARYWEGLLHSGGYQVAVAPNGREATQVFQRIQPDLILLRSTPNLPTSEVSREIKSSAAGRSTPIILITPPPQPGVEIPARDENVDEVIGEAVWPGEKLARVQSLLNLKTYIDQQAESVVLALARSIEGRDPCTENHCKRLSQYAVALGGILRLPEEQVRALWVAGIVHDVGKVVVPDAVLFKPAPLTPEEFAVMQQHAVVGEQICAPLKSFRHVLPIVRHHHERMNGSGYPDGLMRNQIPLTARILQIADVYDALTTSRPYRGALTREEAFAMMHAEARKGMLDGFLLTSFERMLDSARPGFCYERPGHDACAAGWLGASADGRALLRWE